MVEIDEQVLEDLYSWIDQIPLSRPKKDLKRDFSDGGSYASFALHYMHTRLTCRLADVHEVQEVNDKSKFLLPQI